ncbi:MAG: hypothetical protein JXQ30_14890 [Spirochaetes bacterium]|nr:hypothetical protein [Spirochaetota bacterium]
MGLLSKAQLVHEKEQTQNKEGLLSAASRFSGSKPGLLERAEDMMQSGESEAEEAESHGLLQKAKVLRQGEGPAGGKKEVGLLEKAETFRKEKIPEERGPAGLVSPEGRTTSGLLEKVSVVEELETGEEFPPSAVPSRAVSKEAKKKRKRAPKKKVSVKKKGKKPAAPTQKKPEAAFPHVKEPEHIILAKMVRERDIKGSRFFLSDVLSKSGSDGLFDLILKAGCELTKSKSGMIFAFHEKRYRPIAAFFLGKPIHGYERLTYGPRSKLVNLLESSGIGPLLSSRAERSLPKRDAERLKDLMPWMAIPVTAGSGTGGFYLFGNGPARVKVDEDALSFFSSISAPFLVAYSFKEEIKALGETLKREKEESAKLAGLYDYSGRMGKRGLLKGALDRCASLFHIETAVLVTGWETKGALDVSAGIGVTDEERKRIRFSRSDGEVSGIVSRGEPGVPKDAEKRLRVLKDELERDFKSYIVVPVVFHGTCLAVLLVLDKKGVKKKLSQAVRSELLHIAGFLVPYLIHESFSRIDSFSRLESQVEHAVGEAEREGGSLTLLTCTVRNIDKTMNRKRYEKFRPFFESVRRSCEEIVADDGWVETASFKRILLFIRDLDAERVDGIAGRVKERFAQMVKKENFPKLTLAVGKKENADLLGFLKEIY